MENVFCQYQSWMRIRSILYSSGKGNSINWRSCPRDLWRKLYFQKFFWIAVWFIILMTICSLNLRSTMDTFIKFMCTTGCQKNPIRIAFWVEKRELSCSVGGNTNWYSQYGRQYGDSLKPRNKTTIWPNNPNAGHVSWENHN